MNVLVVIFFILIIWKIYKGFKNGFAKEVTELISLVMALIILPAAILLIAGIVKKNIRLAIACAVFMLVISVVYRLISMLLKSVETIAKLPIIHWADMLLGAAAGALEVLLILWIVYIIIGSFPTGRFGEQIMDWTKESTILINIYHKNYIANWLAGLKIKI